MISVRKICRSRLWGYLSAGIGPRACTIVRRLEIHVLGVKLAKGTHGEEMAFPGLRWKLKPREIVENIIAAVATVLATTVGRYCLKFFAWDIGNMAMATAVAGGMVIVALASIWVFAKLLLSKQVQATKRRKAKLVPVPRYSRKIRLASAAGVLLAAYLLVEVIGSYWAYLSFAKEASAAESFSISIPVRTDQQTDFVVFVQDFDGHGARKGATNFAERIYARLVGEIGRTPLRVDVRRSQVPAQTVIDDLLRAGKQVIAISGWYDNYTASIEIRQFPIGQKGRRFLSPPENQRAETYSKELSDPRQWTYFVRVGAAREATYVVIHIVGRLLLADEHRLLLSNDYQGGFNDILTAFHIAERSLPKKMSWFGFVPVADPGLRPEILYNDIGRAYYAKAMRTYGPYTPEEQALYRQSPSTFLRLTTQARITNYRAAESWFARSYSANPSFLSPLVNEIYAKFGLYANTGVLRRNLDTLESDVRALLARPNLQHDDRDRLENELAFLRQVSSGDILK